MNALTNPIREWMQSHPRIIYTGEMHAALRYFADTPESVALVPRVLHPHVRRLTGARIINQVEGANAALKEAAPCVLSPEMFTMLWQGSLLGRHYKRRLLLHVAPEKLRGYTSMHTKATRDVSSRCDQVMMLGFSHVARPSELWAVARIMGVTTSTIPQWIKDYATTVPMAHFERETGFKPGAVEKIVALFRPCCFPVAP